MRYSLTLLLLAALSSCLTAIRATDLPLLEARPKVGEIPIDFEQLIVSLRNKNPRPEIVSGRRVQFGEEYDFREQRRIRKAVFVLQVYAEEAWPHLVAHIKNADYSCTMEISDSPRNYTVGRVCEQVIRNSLYARHDVCGEFLEDTELTMSDLKDPELNSTDNLRSWLNERKEKSLLQLQEELAENLKKRIIAFDLTDAMKVSFVGFIDEHTKMMKEYGYAYPQVRTAFIPNCENIWFQSRPDAK